MKLYAIVESYPPMMMAGSEMAAHTLFRYLVQRGHDVRVHITREPTARYELDGVKVVAKPGRWKPDLAYTHLFEACHLAQNYAFQAGIPLVFWAHSLEAYQIGDLWIANTEVLASTYKGSGEMAVLHPPVFRDEYRTSRSRALAITRIGLSRVKGGHIFWELVHRMPDHDFLGVVGGWAVQLMQLPPRNCTVMGSRTDMRRVYEQTRVLIMPSDGHETYGRVAVEAMASGIPVVGSAQPGMVEAQGSAGIYIDLGDIECYEDVLRCLDNPRDYRYHSRLAAKRADWLTLQAERELVDIEVKLRKIAGVGVERLNRQRWAI